MVQPQPFRVPDKVLAAAALAALAVVLAACASPAPVPPSSPVSSSTASFVPPAIASSPAIASDGSASLVSPPAPSPRATNSSAADGAPTKLTGTIEAGVESGCIVLTDDTGAALANLIGLDSTTAPFGSLVDVTGKFQTGMMTTCQQGKPFAVAAVEVR